MRNPFRRNDDAAQSRRDAERALARTRAETPKVQALGRALTQMVDDNHLGEALTRAFREQR